MSRTTLTTKQLLEALRNHYIAPGDPAAGGLFVHEVGENGAYGNSSRCDALYAGFTSASGRILIGHELKVSRADWRHELKQVNKADYWADQCHAWYIVAPSTGIVPAEEVPHGWGLMVPNPRAKRSFTVVLRPTIHADRQPSWNAMRSMMARADTLRQAEVRDLVNAEVVKREKERGKRETQLDMTGQDARELQRLRGLVRDLERHLGVELGSDYAGHWSAPEPETLATALAITKNMGMTRWAESTASNAVRQLQESTEALVKVRDGLKELRLGIGKEQDPEAPAALAAALADPEGRALVQAIHDRKQGN